MANQTDFPLIVSEEITTNSANINGDHKGSSRAARLMRWATYASVSVACILIVAKFSAWMTTQSVSLLSTLIDSILDVAASLVNLIAVKHALEPADSEHRFGHGKAESLAGLAQAAFVAGSAAFLLIEAIERILNPRDILNADIGYWVMALSIVLTMMLLIFQRYVISISNSVAIKADSMHYRMDILVNIGVIISIYLVSTLNLQWIDPVVAILIAGYIVYGAWSIAKQSLHILMDHELPESDRSRITEIAMTHDSVRGVHDMRTRTSGLDIFIQLHMELDGAITLLEAHHIGDDVEAMIKEVFPSAEVLIHQDPEGLIEKIDEFR